MEEERFKKGIESIKKITLTNSEKDQMLFILLNKIEESPEQKPASLLYQFAGWHWSTIYYYGSSLALLIVIVGATTSFAAEKALPGDTLYHLKVGLNEPLRTALIKDLDNKIDWEGEKLDRRLSEVEALVSRGNISDENTKQLEKNLETNLNSFEEIIKENQDVDEQKINNAEFRLNVRKDAHEKIIEKIQSDKDDKEKEKIGSLQESVKDKINKKLEEINKERGKKSGRR